MARISTNFMSEALKHPVQLEIVVPTDHMVMKDKKMPEANVPYKTLYYLEGALGDCSGPLNYSRMMGIAEDYNMVVVCIGGENKWYGNSCITGDKYGDLVTRDIVNFTRRLFNLSDKREDTFIGGFSMGGHGAFVLGLRNPELFGYIVSIDASLQKMAIETAVDEEERWDISSRSAYAAMFGLKDVSEWAGSDQDYEFLAKQTAAEKKALMPKIFMCCGKKDGLYDANTAYRDMLMGYGYDVTWVDLEENHSYHTVDDGLDAAAKWLPLTDNFRSNYCYYGPEAYCSIENFNGWKAFYNVEAEKK